MQFDWSSERYKQRTLVDDVLKSRIIWYSPTNTLGPMSTTGVFPFLDGIRPSFLGPASPLPLPLSISCTGLSYYTFCHLLEMAHFLLLLLLFLLFSHSTMWNHLSLASRASPSTFLLLKLDYSVSSHCMKSQRGGGVFLKDMLANNKTQMTNE
jgi:hypothetical protein